MITQETYLKMKSYIAEHEAKQSQVGGDTIPVEQPYTQVVTIEVENKYNPRYGDYKECKCGHEYHRHFDSYDSMEAVGCKYCNCYEFEEAK